MSKEKVENCPIDKCKTPCTGAHRMASHIKGTHLKNRKDLDVVLSKVEEKTKKNIKNVDYWTDLLEILQIIEPECTPADEKICSDKGEDSRRGFNIKDFFDLENPICREERQYAHFFASKLEQNDEDIVGKLRNELGFSTIVQVYFECTFMRDYWCANKETYNKKLKLYLKEKKQINEWEMEKENKETNHPNHWEKSHPYARWMTNAKPDIGLLVKKEGEFTLHFLECKYLSEEDIYNYEDYKKAQTDIQEEILEFLCKKGETGLGLKCGEESVEAGKVKLVRFENGEKTKNGDIHIKISELLSKNNCA